ncbi:Nicotinamide N-methyltransferase-like [Carpediemonas membranifera]|uniref:Nicotinamide N-methyltransferase-like n=1 Tax=Carpediemonas membranifera TaxID=201153 RepID=A0A8J6DZG1_9EUKA|nr:Nicotinamide N-methyltransferase-like [Carpediemonas membranifera]|eukprot:KAG9390356.1 Nicotinamide N-methyltransferase-like [Carpediemonas membranifera]
MKERGWDSYRERWLDSMKVDVLGEQMAFQQTDALAGDGNVGGTLWDASFVLANYLPLKYKSMKGMKTVEFGCGVSAITTIFSGALGAHAIATDLPDVTKRAQENITRNLAAVRKLTARSGGEVHTQPFVWGQDNVTALPKADLLLCAETFYYEHLVDPLIDVLIGMIQHSPKAVGIAAHWYRGTEGEKIFHTRGPKVFKHWRELDPSELHPDYTSENVAVIVFSGLL